MAYIVCITGGLTGLLNASLALVSQLQRAGHQVTYASPADLRASVTAQGIDYVQLDRWVMQSGDPPMSRWQKWRTLRERQQRAVDALGVQNFVQMMRSLDPDLLLIDMEMHPHIMAAVTEELPVALLCQFLSIWQQPDLPPIHTKTVPDQRWLTRLNIAWSWWFHSGKKRLEFQRERWRRMGLDWVSILRCYAQQIGYPWHHPWRRDQWLLPYTHGQLPILCLNALELDFLHAPHPLMHYVGPMVLENRWESKVTPDTESALEHLFENCQTHGRALIYCACSTFIKSDQQFLQRLIQAVSSCPEWELVLGLGGQLDLSTLGILPDNIHAFDWVPQVRVLKYADCAINNGGINSINECLYLGVPMLVYSLQRFDQDGNAARVTYHGLGIAGDIGHDRPEQIRGYLRTLLSDSSYQQRIEQMRECSHRYIHKNRAAEVVETLLDAQRPAALAVAEREGMG